MLGSRAPWAKRFEPRWLRMLLLLLVVVLVLLLLLLLLMLLLVFVCLSLIVFALALTNCSQIPAAGQNGRTGAEKGVQELQKLRL